MIVLDRAHRVTCWKLVAMSTTRSVGTRFLGLGIFVATGAVVGWVILSAAHSGAKMRATTADLECATNRLTSSGFNVCPEVAVGPNYGPIVLVLGLIVAVALMIVGWALRAKPAAADSPLPGLANYHADPTGRFAMRWWDGAAWTSNVVTSDGTLIDEGTGKPEAQVE